jgi:hypothetical protein
MAFTDQFDSQNRFIARQTWDEQAGKYSNATVVELPRAHITSRDEVILDTREWEDVIADYQEDPFRETNFVEVVDSASSTILGRDYLLVGHKRYGAHERHLRERFLVPSPDFLAGKAAIDIIRKAAPRQIERARQGFLSELTLFKRGLAVVHFNYEVPWEQLRMPFEAYTLDESIDLTDWQVTKAEFSPLLRTSVERLESFIESRRRQYVDDVIEYISSLFAADDLEESLATLSIIPVYDGHEVESIISLSADSQLHIRGRKKEIIYRGSLLNYGTIIVLLFDKLNKGSGLIEGIPTWMYLRRLFEGGFHPPANAKAASVEQQIGKARTEYLENEGIAYANKAIREEADVVWRVLQTEGLLPDFEVYMDVASHWGETKDESC